MMTLSTEIKMYGWSVVLVEDATTFLLLIYRCVLGTQLHLVLTQLTKTISSQHFL